MVRIYVIIEDASRLIVKTAIANINDKAKSTREKPSQIIQDIHSAVPITARPYMPSVEATRKIILRARRKMTEKAAINAVSNIFPECEQTGCFFHLGQSIWRKIQSSGLATHYGNDIAFALKLRCLWSLAFLPPEQIPDAFDNLSANYSVPDVIKTYFEENYIRGKIKRTFRNGSSVYYNNENNIPPTQNNVESWHKRWKILVGAEHVEIYRLIIELRQIELIVSGNQRPKPKLASIKRQLQIQNVIEDNNNRNTIDFLKGISYNLNF
ncbi:hypothetical protein QTP88_007213 [Uroleucon formosanum]